MDEMIDSDYYVQTRLLPDANNSNCVLLPKENKERNSKSRILSHRNFPRPHHNRYSSKTIQSSGSPVYSNRSDSLGRENYGHKAGGYPCKG